jgi:putative transcriptional regulator
MSPSEQESAVAPGHSIEIHLHELLETSGMTLTELANHAGITIANFSILKNGRARTIRFSTLTKLCEILSCQPGHAGSAQEQKNGAYHVLLWDGILRGCCRLPRITTWSRAGPPRSRGLWGARSAEPSTCSWQ